LFRNPDSDDTIIGVEFRVAEIMNSVTPELITLYIGLETPTNRDASAAKDRAIKILTAHFPSFTVTDGTEFFRGEQEKVLVAHIATSNPQEVADCAEIVRVALNQEGVGIAFRGHYFRATEDGVPMLITDTNPSDYIPCINSSQETLNAALRRDATSTVGM
jgi:hypothetical protein